MRKTFLAVSFFVFVFMALPVHAESDLTAEQVITNIEKAWDGVNDLQCTLVATNKSSDGKPVVGEGMTSRILYKKDAYWLTETDGGIIQGREVGKIEYLVKKESNSIRFDTYSEKDKKILSSEMGNNIENEDLFNTFGAMVNPRSLRSIKAISVEKMSDASDGSYALTYNMPYNKFQMTVYVRSRDWIIYKSEVNTPKGIATSEVKDLKINQGLSDEVFKLNAPEGTPVEEAGGKKGKVSSVDILNFGRVTPDTVKNKSVTCAGCAAGTICALMHDPKNMESTDTVPAIFDTGFGILYRVNGEPKGGYVSIKQYFIHPPIEDPLTREVVTMEEYSKTETIGSASTAAWGFTFLRELVPGDWTIQIVDGDRILAEKIFHVTASSNPYMYNKDIEERINNLTPRIKAGDATAMNDFGNLHRDRGDYNQAIVWYTKAIDKDPQPEFYNNRCAAWENKQDHDKALDDCNQALAVNSKYVSALVNRGLVYENHGEFERAVADYSQALVLAPQSDNKNRTKATMNRGLSYVKLRKYDEAIKDFSRLIDADPQSKPAYHNRGMAYEIQGELEKARADYQKILSIDPNDTLARWKMKRLDEQAATKVVK